MKYLHSVHPFRTSFTYNNLMYGIASLISEKLGGKKWEDLVTENLYQPLGMSNSTFLTRMDPHSQEIAQGYVDDRTTSQGVAEVPFEFNRYNTSIRKEIIVRHPLI